ncbi:hypothetical protein [Actinomadura macrotermitis]|uniref:Uncharacterized protein n=1 Tax=Actinomadura macrotermitis TaxID=2585200 RepID=A0A7K0C519_9ACTN|nr:hypothetical protein [Actinomadura macrotermitis]MQY08508.1 hypothetical protein [Actinomadura macrotermitis]
MSDMTGARRSAAGAAAPVPGEEAVRRFAGGHGPRAGRGAGIDDAGTPRAFTGPRRDLTGIDAAGGAVRPAVSMHRGDPD